MKTGGVQRIGGDFIVQPRQQVGPAMDIADGIDAPSLRDREGPVAGWGLRLGGRALETRSHLWHYDG